MITKSVSQLDPNISTEVRNKIRYPSRTYYPCSILMGTTIAHRTSDTKYLVIPNGEQPEDSKIRNALDKGATVIGIDDFRKEIEK